MRVLFGQVAAALLGIVLLQIFFRVAESKWPQSYYSIADLLSYRISSSPVKYTLFRFGPVVVVTFFLSASLIGAGEALWPALAILVGGHIVLTTARGLFDLLRTESPFAFEIRLLAHLAVTVGIVVASAVGMLLGSFDRLQSLVQADDELPQSLWTASLAAIVGVFLLEVTQGSPPEASELLSRSRESIPDGLWERTRQLAEDYGSDPSLALAILAVENLQRPRWFRRMEQLKGRLWKRGSYGIMQVRADRPISDLESVKLALKHRLSNVRVPRDEYGADYEGLRRILMDYNPDERFIEMAQAFYEEIAPAEEEDPERRGILAGIDWEEMAFQAVPVATGFLLGACSVSLVSALRKLRAHD